MQKLMSYTTLTVLAVDLLATVGDITMTWTSPMLSKLYSNDSSVNPLPAPITKEEDAYIAALINIGAMVGGIPFSILSDKFGRKLGLLTIGIFHVLAYLTLAFARNVYLFYFGRIFGGLATGAGYTLLPIYIAEVSEESNRGFYSMTLTIFWAVGNFLPLLVGPFLTVRTFNLFNAALGLAFFALFLVFGVESPYYLVAAGKTDEAGEALMRLRSADDVGVKGELNQIRSTLDSEKEHPMGASSIFTNRGLRKAFAVSVVLISFQQLSGWNVTTFYLQPIFEAARTVVPAHWAGLIVGGAILAFSLPAPLFADRFGRKTLLVASVGLMAVCLCSLSLYFFLDTRTAVSVAPIAWLPLASLVFLAFAYDLGMACLPWTISSELFPSNVKKFSASTTSAFCWIATYLTTQFFNVMVDSFGMDGTYLIFTGFCLLCIVFTVCWVPETKGKTFKEIQDLLNK
ncbi:unnamed protein product [Phyllotreta striolata]|uniref:Major facilitator superfamily (MFS) profile domain-containing protein n=1 Tax=Phyllotreta striolata TaxID=444603 RepID=A0A9N9TPB6_PHYSR|nr:unnamed protein product [Phyllotreta striolata]